MKIEIPDIIIQELVDANIIQSIGTIASVETRSAAVVRLQYHFSEYIAAVIGKEMRKRKMLPPPTNV